MQRNKIPAGKNPAQKMARNVSVFAFVMCLIVIGIIFVYNQYKNGDRTSAGDDTLTTEVEKLAEKDLELGYPATPTEVMKLFGRINQCMYNSVMDDEDFDQLLTQLRMLYSTTLLDQNSFEEQKDDLKAEVDEFMDSKRKIANYTVDKSSSVKYRTIEGKECAYIQLAFFMSENGKYSKSFQDYILVKENDDWKILAFKKNVKEEEEEKSES